MGQIDQTSENRHVRDEQFLYRFHNKRCNPMTENVRRYDDQEVLRDHRYIFKIAHSFLLHSAPWVYKWQVLFTS